MQKNRDTKAKATMLNLELKMEIFQVKTHLSKTLLKLCKGTIYQKLQETWY